MIGMSIRSFCKSIFTLIIVMSICYTFVTFNKMALVKTPPRVDQISPLHQINNVLVDKKENFDGKSLNMKQSLEKILKMSNIPFSYWKTNYSNKFTSDGCIKFPNIYEIQYNNIYWQVMKSQSTTFYLLNAYFDMRKSVGTIPLVRIISMIDKISPPQVVCQFWYGNITKTTIPTRLKFSKAFYTYMWVKNWGNYKDGILQPYLISCPVPKVENMSYVPASVSLVDEFCQTPTNVLKVIYKRPKEKEKFAVCVKGLDFLHEDISVKLIEWIELLNILGAKKIFFYQLEIHENISKVLNYYSNKNIIELTPITLPGAQPNLPGFRHLYLKSKLTNKRQNELIPYNDCLYKNLYSYDYVVLLDTDEIILPKTERNWQDMMTNIDELSLKEAPYSRASYNFRNVYFFDEVKNKNETFYVPYEKGIPRYLHMLQHVYRSKNYTKQGNYVKCFHNIEHVITLHNHFPINCFGLCTTYPVPTSVGHLQHYRKDCVDPLKSKCDDFRKNTVRDTTIWKFKDELIRRTTETLFNLGFHKDQKNHDKGKVL